MAPRVVLYTVVYCRWCYRARRLLDGKGTLYDQRDVTIDLATRRWLADVTGRRTLPQLFIDGRSLGGYREMAGLDASGELDRLLAGTPLEHDGSLVGDR